MRFFTSLSAIMLLVCQSATGDELTGRVTDPSSNPIPSVSVVTNVRSIGTVTDVEGGFALETSPQTTRITFSSIGYKSRQFAVDDLPKVVVLEEMYYPGEDIIVTADRAQGGISPMAFANISPNEIDRDYTVAEFPLLLNSTPNVYAYTDGGAPLGGNELKIRGFDNQRIATYINGVPLNDPEDHRTYFVDMPDFTSNISDIQVQRGVGNSLYGDASFGGTVNVVTNTLGLERRVQLTAGYGEFTSNGKSVSDIYRQNVEYASGLIDGRWAFTGRFSKQKTGGYRHHSWYEGWSYYLSAARLDPRMTTEVYIYGGPIRYHAAWYGAPRGDIKQDRRANPWLTYANETDNFNQPHYQLHNTYRVNEQTTLQNTLYNIRGKGHYEQFKSGRDYAEYNLTAMSDSAWGDLVRQKWVFKNQVGWNPRLDIEHPRGRHTLGGSFYFFDSDHWGTVVSAQFLNGDIDPTHRYYEYYGKKYVASLSAQETYELTDRLTGQATAQLRFERYDFEQKKMGAFVGHEYDLDWLFFSPRLGLNYAVDERNNVYFSAAVASRPPNDENIYDADDPEKFPQLEVLDTLISGSETTFEFGDPTVESERVYDFELGAQHRAEKYEFHANLFYMLYNNENVFEGGLDEFFREITINIDRAVHAGIEVSGSWRPLEYLATSASFSLNFNRIREYDTTVIFGVGDSDILDFKDKKSPNFPDVLGGLIIDYQRDPVRVTYSGRVVGRQYVELWNIDSLSIEPYFTSSLKASVAISDFLQVGKLTVMAAVDNLFDVEYEVSGYGGNWAWRDANNEIRVDGWGEYFVGPERSFYGQLQLELF